MTKTSRIVALSLAGCLTLGLGIGGGYALGAKAVGRASTPGYFGQATKTNDGFASVGSLMVDWDGDGFPDLIRLVREPQPGGTDRLLLYTNDGAGDFGLEADVPIIGLLGDDPIFEGASVNLASPGDCQLLAADIDSNGVPELVISGRIIVFNTLAGTSTNLDGVWIIPNTLAPWQPALNRRADFNGDQNVDAQDLAYLLGAWGPVVPPPAP